MSLFTCTQIKQSMNTNKNAPVSIFSLIVIVSAVIGGVVGSFAVQSLLKSSSNGDVDTVLKQTAEQLNKQLPMTVDKYTRLDTTVALPGGKFNYRYTIFSVDELPEAAEFEKSLKPKLINLYQNGDDMKHLRAVNATLVYSYFLEDGTEFISFEILADDSYDANAQNTNEDL